MQRAAAILLVLAIALALFACWGLFTLSGRHRFDEMAGILPVGAGLAAAPLFAVALLLRRRSASRRS